MADGDILAGKRKLIVTLGVSVVVIGIGTAMVFWGHMSSDQWVDLAKWVGGGGAAAFAISNGIEHLAGRR